MISEDIFFDKSAYQAWMEEEKKRRAKENFKFIEGQSELEYWEFIEKTLHGNYRHVFFGQYRDVIK